MSLDVAFWLSKARELGYPVDDEEISVDSLKENLIFPRELNATLVLRLYSDGFVEFVVVVVDKLSKRLCTETARNWKEKRSVRPILIFTDNKDESFVVVVPGQGTRDVRILHVQGRLYKSDVEVIESLRFWPKHEMLKEAYDKEMLSYESVRNDFFSGYKALYEKIVDATKDVLHQNANSYAQRFLGRLMLLYFLQKKGWLRGDRNFIDKVRNYSELNHLFYESMGKKGGGNGVPFLGSSLFEREEYLTEEAEKKITTRMSPLFYEARNFFDKFNFIVDEPSPSETDAGISPLLLGTVLENMLPEHERGEKGTFYTPVNEVSFMCRRAIASWLGIDENVEERNGELRLVDGLEKYIAEMRQRRNEKEVREFREKLLSLKILDPAVGSGGFLVVMMQTILQLVREAEESVGWKPDMEQYRRRIVSNLFGFDIEHEAVEIARLRIWLSFIGDQEKPEPLPNLDLNIVAISDSLEVPRSVQRVLGKFLGDPEISSVIESLKEAKVEYLNEQDPTKKSDLRRKIEETQQKYLRLTGLVIRGGMPIEFFMPDLADIVVTNPPYVRQEKIPVEKKRYYVSNYRLDSSSDLYAYFMLRSLRLLKRGGVAVLITSDKWLETEYGKTLQQILKPYIVAVYGQGKKSFTADVNTVITVLRKDEQPEDKPIQFAYFESYGSGKVRNYKAIERRKLQPGKWYYLRAPRIFEEVFLPRLTHRLKDFAELWSGINTGADEFFLMKDITHLFETDRIANPRKFAEWGVTAKTAKELQDQGLVYVENKAGERFVIDRKDVRPIVRTPKEVRSYVITNVRSLCLYTTSPGRFTRKYIKWGEQQRYHLGATCKSRNPWWALPEIKPAHILLPEFWLATIYIPYSEQAIICSRVFYLLRPKNLNILEAWKYLNSTLFFLSVEMFTRRLCGGPTDTSVRDFENIPVPDLSNLRIDFPPEVLASIRPLKYRNEVKRKERAMLDKAVLRALGFEESKIDELVEELHKAFVETVDDRLKIFK
ncbi:MAG: Eco57I restriction-modification methylase domain-containing protein [Caldisericaceae bacterium]